MAERTTRETTIIIDGLNFFKTAPVQQNGDILLSLIKRVKTLLQRSVESLSIAQEAYKSARERLTDIAATLKNVKRDITVSQKLLTAKNADEVQGLKEEAQDRKNEIYSKLVKLVNPVLTSLGDGIAIEMDRKGRAGRAG